MKKRLDQHLVDEGLAPSKTKAQEMIEAGQVMIIIEPSRRALVVPESKQEQLAQKSSMQIDPEKIKIKIADENLLKYVSRAGFKLEGALEELKLDVTGFCALDVGQSTGGFTDCLLQRGAVHVTGVDVGKNELVESLARDKRVRALTGVNVRDLKEMPELIKEKFDLVVVDVSFISLEKVIPEIAKFIRPKGYLLALVKPQFEVGSVNLDKRGIVKSQIAVVQVEKSLKALCSSLGIVGIRYFAAKIKGRDGNQEFIIFGEKK